MDAPRRWTRLVVAAITVGIITISGIAYFNSNNTVAVDNPQWVTKQLKGVSDMELDEFVKTAVPTQATSGIAVNKKDGEEVEKLLKDVPDNELQAFLDQMPEEELAFN